MLTASALKLLDSGTSLLVAAVAVVGAAALAQSLRRRPRPGLVAIAPEVSGPSPLPPVVPEPLPAVSLPEASP